MGKSNHHEKFLELRKEFPFFTYENYFYEFTDHGLDIGFDFNLSDRYRFHPTIFIPYRSFFSPISELRPLMPNVVFHLGLIELISYWKVSCAPLVVIKPHQLTVVQAQWWKKLYFHGLGEFFYLNGIHTDQDSFMEIKVASNTPVLPLTFLPGEDVIIPVGGGKDSIVTMELLGKSPGTAPLIVNPRNASIHNIVTAGYTRKEVIEVYRSIYPTLLDLNNRGFLNGHTPFSALLAFISVLAAALTGKRYIALSNESSANETTIPGLTVNHQYSKSFGFEKDFRGYVNRFITPNIDYFSFLRPLNEIRIAGLFSEYPNYFSGFKSCNVGSHTDTWCGKCPKCLFTFCILAPFLPYGTLTGIFSKDLLDDQELLPVFNQLIGVAPEKPFECVGTVEEVNAAIMQTLDKSGDHPLPYLLRYYQGLPETHRLRAKHFNSLLTTYNRENFLPDHFVKRIPGAIYG